MEELKCHYHYRLFWGCFWAVLLPLLACIFITKDVSAYSFGDVGNFSYASSSSSATPGTSSATSYFNPTDGTRVKYFTRVDYNSSNSAVVSIFNTNPSSGYLNNVQLDVISLTSGEYIPAHSLFSFSVRYAGLSGGNLKYNGISTYGDWTLLNDSCVQSASQTSNSNTYAVDFACTYYGYTENAIDVLRFYGYIVNFELNGLMVVASPGSYVQVSSDDGSSVVIDDISDDVGDILGEIRNNNTQNSYIYVRMADMMDLLQDIQDGQLSQSAIEQAVQNAQEAANETEKSQYEEQAEETEETANQESSAAQSSATSLLTVVGQFITVLTSTQPTDCNLDGNLIPHLSIGNLNLCQNSPPTAITVLGSLVLVAFVVPLCYHTVKRMLALIGSFQS